MKKNLLTAISVFSLFVAQAQVTNGLVAHYSFNNGNANDDAGTNNGTVSNATLTSDRFGNANMAYAFNSTNSSYISVPHSSTNDFSNSSSFSIAAWVKFLSPGNTTSFIVAKSQPGFWNGYYFIANSADPGYCNGAGTIFFYTASGAQQDACGDSTYASNFNKWYFLTGVYNGTANTSTFYVNGIAQQDIGQVSGSLSNPNANLCFGGDPNNPFGSYFNGEMDDIRIYNRVLTQGEIDSLYNEPNPVTTGINSITKNQLNLKVAPNPANDFINVSLTESGTVQIFNPEGRHYASYEVKKGENQLPVAELPSGIFLIKFESKQGFTSHQKLIKN